MKNVRRCSRKRKPLSINSGFYVVMRRSSELGARIIQWFQPRSLCTLACTLPLGTLYDCVCVCVHADVRKGVSEPTLKRALSPRSPWQQTGNGAQAQSFFAAEPGHPDSSPFSSCVAAPFFQKTNIHLDRG